jgi:flagellar hook-associated protein 1 FlgK
MSLSSILNTASTALSNVDFQISVGNANIANASDTSYTRKVADIRSLTPTLLLTSSSTTRVTNSFLTSTVISTNSDSARDQAVNAILQNYDQALGSTTDGNDISSRLTALQTALTNISGQGADPSSKGQFVSAASALAAGVRNLSSTVQSLRTDANTQISDTISDINTQTAKIDSLNRQIVAAQSQGQDISNLEDQRDAALQTLSGDIGVSYYVTPQNTMQVFTGSGDLLVGDSAMPLSYASSSALSSGASYPGSISGIMLAGKDITTAITSGKIAGLISLRDNTLPGEQAKLDSLAKGLITAANTASNAGSAYPPPATLTGTATVSAGAAITGSGSLTVTLTDTTGKVTSTQAIDLSSVASVQDVIDQLNAIPNVTAQINAQGQLSVSTTNGNGLALSGGALTDASGASSGVSAYFGLNNLFAGSGAADIAVNPAIANNPSQLPTATLNTSATVGQIAVASGDTTNVDALNKALTGLQSFSAAGSFPAQTTSLQSYATAFVSSAANLVSNASTTAQTSQATFSAAQSRLQNLTTVNTDEELANLQTLEQQYQANAQMIATVRTMFTALIQMVQA